MASCGGRQKFIIRTSDRGIFKDCRQRWDFTSKIRQDYEPKGGQIHFNFGTSIHAGLETRYNPLITSNNEELAIAAFLGSEQGFMKAEAKLYIDEILPQEKIDEFNERRELGVGMLKHYFQWCKDTDDILRVVKVEIEFEVPIPATPKLLETLRANPTLFAAGVDELHGAVPGKDWFLHCWCDDCGLSHPVVYQGRVDMIVEDKHGRYWIWDHKTAGQFGSTEYFDLDDQCGSYIWALQRMLGLPIMGVVYNRLLKAVPHPPEVLKNGSLSKNKQQRTTYDLYIKAMELHAQPYAPYAEFLEFLKAKPNQFFQRVEVHRAAVEIPIIERRILMEAIDMLDDPKIYPNPGMFTCMGCAFKTPCLATQDGSDVEFILRTNYQKRETDGISGSSDGSTNSGDTGRTEGPARL